MKDRTTWKKLSLQQNTPSSSLKRPADTEDNSPSKRIRTERLPVVLFSNFKDGSEYDNTRKTKLCEIVTNLGGTVVNEGEEGLTHLVCPPNSRTIKTLKSRLAGIWIISAEWLEDSAKENCFVSENPYGQRGNKDVITGKKFYVSQAYKEDKRNEYKLQCFLYLLESGNATLVEDPSQADFVLIKSTQSKSKEDYGTAEPMYWNNFVTMIVPN